MNPLLAVAVIKLAVLDFSVSGVDPVLARNLSEVLLTECAAIGTYQVVGSSDIQALLGFEQERQLLGCGNDSCLAEIGGALGVEKLVVGTLGRVEDTYLLTLKLIDMRTARVESRVAADVEGKAAKLIGAIRQKVPELFAKTAKAPALLAIPAASTTPAPAAATTVPPAALAPAPVESSTNVPRLAAWSGLVAGVVGVVVGGVFAWKSSAAQQRYDEAVLPSDIATARTDTESSRGSALVGFAVGGLLGVAGGVGLVAFP